jgi:DNA-binding NarL/FixJ family response regulator
MSISVLLADDQPLLRRGFRMILEAEGDLTVVAEAGDGDEAADLARRHTPDVVLMDIRMPGTDGIEATRRITAADPRVRVLVLTTFDLDEYAFGALRSGASGFLLKDVRPAELVAAIRTVAAGDAVVSPRITRRLLEEYAQVLPLSAAQREQAYPQLSALTEREREVLIAVAQGLSNGEIAARLYVSEATVKSHVGRILAKLGLRDRVQVVVLAYETGLVRPGIKGLTGRRRRESNPCTGLCRPLPKPLGHSAARAYGPSSGRRDSNPRPSPWQGDALPTEPRPRAPGVRSEL